MLGINNLPVDHPGQDGDSPQLARRALPIWKKKNLTEHKAEKALDASEQTTNVAAELDESPELSVLLGMKV